MNIATHSLSAFALAAVCTASIGLAPTTAQAEEIVRVPAEWEPQEAVWMQWPPAIEGTYKPNFADIIEAAQSHQPVELLVMSTSDERAARSYLSRRGVSLDNVGFHIVKHDWSWMRDNGPIYVERNGEAVIQDWGFDGWGGYAKKVRRDDAVPCQVADAEDVSCEDHNGFVTERGTMEFNGEGAMITSWTVLHDRNPMMTKADMERYFLAELGVTQTVWLEGSPSDDITGGHTDGVARFIDASTVAVARYLDRDHQDAWVYDLAAEEIAAAGFDVVRMDVPGEITYKGARMSVNYMNWLVINDAVILTGFGTPSWDQAAARTVEGYFPGREVYVVNGLELWYYGGGIHCVTNDQPAAP